MGGWSADQGCQATPGNHRPSLRDANPQPVAPQPRGVRPPHTPASGDMVHLQTRTTRVPGAQRSLPKGAAVRRGAGVRRVGRMKRWGGEEANVGCGMSEPKACVSAFDPSFDRIGGMTTRAGQESPVVRCLECGYVLNGLDGRCPECGRLFSRDDPRTYGVSRSPNRSAALRAGLAMVGGFSIVIVAAGHGILPLGIFYIGAAMGEVSYGQGAWAVWPVVIGWLGLLAAGFAWAWPTRVKRRISLVIAALLLIPALTYFWRHSEASVITAGTAVPFFLALLRYGWVLAFDWPTY